MSASAFPTHISVCQDKAMKILKKNKQQHMVKDTADGIFQKQNKIAKQVNNFHFPFQECHM